MEIQLLGPVELWVDGRQVGLGPPQQRTVAAALALEAGKVVPVDRLVALVWPGEPPPSARNALQALVSRLRRLLAGTEARLLTRPPRRGERSEAKHDPRWMPVPIAESARARGRWPGRG